MNLLGIDVGGGSVKAAGVADGRVTWTAKSRRYTDPSPDDVAAAIAEATAGRAGDVAAVGLCVPGILADDRASIALSVNAPRLNGLPLADLVTAALGRRPASLRVLNDTTAAAYDVYFGRHLEGRLFLMMLGTGVGVCVMDAGGPLSVDGDSPGHFGQLDVSIAGQPVVGPDGGAGSLEGYVGSAALSAAYGGNPAAKLHADDPAGRALVRAIRVAHAMYRPHHVVLAGGLGIRLGRLVPELRAAVNYRLTSVARPGWTLGVGDGDFHAAAGAARAARM